MSTVTEQHPDERVAWKSDSGPNHVGVITFRRLDDDHTRVTAQMDIDPEGFAENAADKLGILDRRVRGDMLCRSFPIRLQSRGNGFRQASRLRKRIRLLSAGSVTGFTEFIEERGAAPDGWRGDVQRPG